MSLTCNGRDDCSDGFASDEKDCPDNDCGDNYVSNSLITTQIDDKMTSHPHAVMVPKLSLHGVAGSARLTGKILQFIDLDSRAL